MPLLILFMVLSIPIYSQEVNLPQGYRGINLRMSLPEVQQRLLSDPWFNYRGEPELSMRERPNSSFIDAGGSLFISRGLFQFEVVENFSVESPAPVLENTEESSSISVQYQLSAIILELNPRNLDWYTLYTTLQERYGEPDNFNPQRAWWQNDRVRLALEKPLTVKYLDQSIFRPESGLKANPISSRAAARAQFLMEF